jgi:hypothetical protein
MWSYLRTLARGAWVCVALGCRALDGGFDGAAPTDVTVDPQVGDGGAASAPSDGPGSLSTALRPRPDARMAEAAAPQDDLRGTSGAPAQTGCADGTREGFVDVGIWQLIAGCSGAFRIPGVVGAPASSPHCARLGGNSGANPAGIGCSIADLCADGWHVCKDAREVERLSPSDCESAAPPGQTRFFAVQGGSSPQGVCYADVAAANDVHGCGTLGQPEVAACQPLDRRLSFADCLASSGVWWCGTASDHLNEANLVFKTDGAFGGALCCKDF